LRKPARAEYAILPEQAAEIVDIAILRKGIVWRLTISIA
jgi:hypothetical protein